MENFWTSSKPIKGLRHFVLLNETKEKGNIFLMVSVLDSEVYLKATYEEGCLSIPDQFAEVTRPKQVQVRWMDLNGGEQTQEFDGLWATCVQHEIDHLNGKLFIDYLGAMKRQMITRKMQKLKRDIARGKET